MCTRSFVFIPITITLCVGLPACQTTITPPPGMTDLPPISMEKADVNGDGALDQDEFKRRLEVLFDMRDVDGNDILVPSELPGVNINAYKHADQNKSGDLTKKEYLYLRTLDFNRLDVNQDGVLVPHEILRW